MRYLLWSTARLAILIALVIAVSLAWMTALSIREVIAWALLGGQAAAVARLAASLWTNPLTAKYIEQIADSPATLRPVRIGTGSHPVASELATRGFVPVVAAVVDEYPIFDIFQSSNRLVTAAVGRQTGSLTFITALSDGRALVTANTLVLPGERLVVNLAKSTDCVGVTEAHRLGMGRLIANDLTPIESTSSAVADLVALEQQGFAALGWLGGFLNLRTRRSWLRLLTTLTPAETWNLAMSDVSDQAGSARTPDYRAEEPVDVRIVEGELSDAPQVPKLRAVG